jgi:hypothetical protein
MASKVGLLTVKSTGHVLSIFSIGKLPDEPPPAASLVTDRLLVRDPDTGEIAASVEPRWLETVLLDVPRDAIVSPRSYRVEKDPQDPDTKTISLQTATVAGIAPTTSGVPATLAAASATPLKAWVQVESLSPPDVLNAEGAFPVVTSSGTHTLTVPLSIPAGQYSVVVAVEGYALYEELNVAVP